MTSTNNKLKELDGATTDSLIVNGLKNGIFEVRIDDDDYKHTRDGLLIRDAEIVVVKDPCPYITVQGRKMYFYTLPEFRLYDTFRDEVNFFVNDKDVCTKKEYKGIWPFGYTECKEYLRTGSYETGRYEEISLSIPLDRVIMAHSGVYYDHSGYHTAKRHRL